MIKLKTVVLLLSFMFANSVFADIKLEITESMVRAPIPGMANTAGYMTVKNTSNKLIVLTSASSDIAKTVEFHNHIMADGVMKMVKLDKVEIPAGDSLVFQSGGLHLMFLGLNEKAKSKESAQVVLYSSSGEKIALNFNIKSVKQQHHHHHH